MEERRQISSQHENTKNKFSILQITYKDLGLTRHKEFLKLREHKYRLSYIEVIRDLVEKGKYAWLDRISNSYNELYNDNFIYDNYDRDWHHIYKRPDTEILFIEYSENEKGEFYLVSFRGTRKLMDEAIYLDPPIKLEQKPQPPSPFSNPPPSTEDLDVSTIPRPQYIQNLVIQKKDHANERVIGKGKVGVCSIQGRRQNNEDTWFVATGENHKLIQEQLEQDFERAVPAMWETFAGLQEKYGNHPVIGSTCCFAVAKRSPINEKTSKVEVKTAYVGDTSACVVVISEDGTVRTKKLTVPLHNPQNELERLSKISLSQTHQILHQTTNLADYCKGSRRLPGDLAVSRSFGDTNFEIAGLIHEPDIVHEEFEVNVTDLVFFIIYCDGAEEYVKDPEAFITNIVKKYWNGSPKVLAEQIVNHAYNGLNEEEHESQDNIIVVVAEVISGDIISAGVGDGHHGIEVADAICENFYPFFLSALSPEIKLAKEKEEEQKAAMAKRGGEIKKHQDYLLKSLTEARHNRDYEKWKQIKNDIIKEFQKIDKNENSKRFNFYKDLLRMHFHGKNKNGDYVGSWKCRLFRSGETESWRLVKHLDENNKFKI